MNAKEKAIKWLLKFKFKNKFKISEESDDFIINESDCYRAIDIAIRTTIEDIYAFKFYDVQTKDIAKWQSKFKDELIDYLKKRHLSTSQKEKELNSSSKKDCLFYL